MSTSRPFLAKSSKQRVLLEDHTRHVCDEAEYILTSRPFVASKYEARTGNDLREILRQSALWHDEGKKHKCWQDACQKDYDETVATGRDSGRHLRKAGIRHEMASLEFARLRKTELPLTVRIAVAAHHGKLSYYHRKRWSDERGFEDFWREFTREAGSFSTGVDEDFERAIARRYESAGARALLQLADHRASAAEEGDELPPLEAFAYEFPHKDKNGETSPRGVQKEIKNFWDEPFAILRAPTGAGKTDAALLWAQHQIESNRADRLVIAMPTRFTANALSIATAKDLSATGLYHSSALYQRTKDNPNPPRDVAWLIDKEQELARRLETPVTVTTIDHLCISLTGTREDHHAVFFNLAHACVVIDEADFYDDFTSQNIVTLLRALRVLDVPVLLMSATVPESARGVYAASGMSVTRIYEDLIDYELSRCIVKRHGTAETPDDYRDLLRRALDGEPTIIYVNTVRRAQQVYKWLERAIHDFDDVKLSLSDVVLYHSRFTEPDKVGKEKCLTKLLGREAWAKNEARGVAILTQIGEISVNISADLMISELCPVDRLAQRAGRLSRFKERGDGKQNVRGELFVVEPQRCKKNGELELYPAPYGHYDNAAKEWKVGESLAKSDELMRDGVYSAKTFVDLVNDLYPTAKEVASHVRENRRALENRTIQNWLILPEEQVENEDDETKGWMSRDIPFQSTIYANFKRSNFDFDEADEVPDTRAKRRRFELRHGIKCHTYEYEAARKKDFLEEMTIKLPNREDEVVWLVNERHYTQELGLSFYSEDVTDEFDG